MKNIIPVITLVLLSSCHNPARTAQNIQALDATKQRAIRTAGLAYAANLRVAAMSAFIDGGNKPIPTTNCTDPKFQTMPPPQNLTVESCTINVPSEKQMEVKVKFTNGLTIQATQDNIQDITPP